jgi:hypothetical protein
MIAVCGAAGPAFGETFEPAGLASYQRDAGIRADAKRGKDFWLASHQDTDGKSINCTSCHGDDLGKAGKHNKSGKLIEPMSRRVNKERYTDAEKVEKWFKRNCKQVLQRECTAAEKGDVLLFLSQS